MRLVLVLVLLLTAALLIASFAIAEPPLPNELGASGQGFNYAVATPVQTSLGQTPVIRLDYQALSRLRLMGKWAGQTSLVQPTYNTLPGFDDTLQKFPLSFNTSVGATLALGPATYLEASYGRSQNRLGSPPVSEWTRRDAVRCPPDLAARIPDCTAAALPPLFPEANVVDRRTYAAGALDDIDPPFWEGGRILLPPRLAWAAPGTGSRIRTTNCSACSNAFIVFRIRRDVARKARALVLRWFTNW